MERRRAAEWSLVERSSLSKGFHEVASLIVASPDLSG